MEYSRVVRQALPSNVQFCKRTIIIAMSRVEIFCAREVRFACIWTEARSCLDSRLEQVISSYVISECRRQDKISSARIEIVGDQVLSWSLLHGQCFASGNF